MANSWFSYTGTIPSVPSSFTKLPVPPPCAGSTSLCAIYALVNATNKPVITTTLRVAISQAVAGSPNELAIDYDPFPF